MSIAFYLTRSVRTIEHYLIYIECIECIKKTYPNAPIIVIRDNETLDFKYLEIDEHDGDNIYYIDSEFNGAAESLRFYYYWKINTFRDQYGYIPATDYAICMHESMFIQTPIKLNHVDKYGYEDFFTAVPAWNIPEDELAMIDIVPKNNEILKKTYYDNSKWHTNFGACSVVTYDFICKVNNQFNIFTEEFLSAIKTHKQRVALERIWGLMFACINYNVNTIYGDINVYHGWMVQRFKLNKDFNYEFYYKHKEYYNNFPIIKCWVGR